MQIQEHFKKSKNTDMYFKKAFPTSDCYVVQGVRTNGQDSGRAMGGLAQLASQKLSVRK